MTFKKFLETKNISLYKLAKDTKIPYSTLSDLANGKTTFDNITLKHAVDLSNYFRISCKELLKFKNDEKEDFRYFRGNVLHSLKREGPAQFVNTVIKKKYIDYYLKNNEQEKGLYLLALIDYLIRINDLEPYISRYNEYRKKKLDSPFFVGSTLVCFATIQEAEKELNITVIPEFKKYNIIEENVFNVA